MAYRVMCTIIQLIYWQQKHKIQLVEGFFPSAKVGFYFDTGIILCEGFRYSSGTTHSNQVTHGRKVGKLNRGDKLSQTLASKCGAYQTASSSLVFQYANCSTGAYLSENKDGVKMW